MAAPALAARESGFVHEAFFYRSLDEYVAGMVEFIREGLAKDEPVMVMIASDRWDAIRAALPDWPRVTFVDMRVAGKNPSRIIAAWNDFVSLHAGQRARGIGEPIWPERSPAEMVECHRHEALLNTAFAHADMTLLCPYDVTGLTSECLDQAVANHPHLVDVDARRSSPSYDDPDPVALLAADPLSPPPEGAVTLAFDGTDLPGLRRFVSNSMRAAGLDDRTVDSIELVVGELAGNSIRHGGGGATVSIWHAEGEVVIDVADRGTIANALVGRLRPSIHGTTGRGLYIVNQCADLVELRSAPERTTVRAHFRI